MQVLDAIVRSTHAAVQARKAMVSEAVLLERVKKTLGDAVRFTGEGRFRAAIARTGEEAGSGGRPQHSGLSRRPKGGVWADHAGSGLNAPAAVPLPALIAEIKHRSPSAGVFKTALSVAERIAAYERNGAAAISYVSEQSHFGGSLEELRMVVDATTIPVLQKDFIVDTYQILEAAAAGVSALLFIARILKAEQLRAFVAAAQAYGIEPVVEIYDEDDLDKALGTTTRVVGVNARDLDSFTVDIDAACRLLRRVPDDILSIGFSGVAAREERLRYAAAGACAVLVGGALMRTEDIDEVFAQL